jgi:hypothetical protein
MKNQEKDLETLILRQAAGVLTAQTGEAGQNQPN